MIHFWNVNKLTYTMFTLYGYLGPIGSIRLNKINVLSQSSRAHSFFFVRLFKTFLSKICDRGLLFLVFNLPWGKNTKEKQTLFTLKSSLLHTSYWLVHGLKLLEYFTQTKKGENENKNKNLKTWRVFRQNIFFLLA